MKKLILIVFILFTGIAMKAQTITDNGIDFNYNDTFASWSGEYTENLNDNLKLRTTSGNKTRALCYLVVNQNLERGGNIVYLKFEDSTIIELDFWSNLFDAEETQILLYNEVMDKLLESNLIKVRIHNLSNGKSRDYDLSSYDYTSFIEKYLYLEEEYSQEKIKAIYRSKSLSDF